MFFQSRRKRVLHISRGHSLCIPLDLVRAFSSIELGPQLTAAQHLLHQGFQSQSRGMKLSSQIWRGRAVGWPTRVANPLFDLKSNQLWTSFSTTPSTTLFRREVIHIGQRSLKHHGLRSLEDTLNTQEHYLGRYQSENL